MTVYTVKSSSLLAARATRAFHEMNPISVNAHQPYRVYRKISYGPMLDIFMIDMRTYRGKNSKNDQSERSPDTSFLGREQLARIMHGHELSAAPSAVFV